jgi:hypothetical protein
VLDASGAVTPFSVAIRKSAWKGRVRVRGWSLCAGIFCRFASSPTLTLTISRNFCVRFQITRWHLPGRQTYYHCIHDV